MDYEKKYKEALERAKLSRQQLLDIGEEATEIEHIFPELKESEGEKMKRVINHILYENYTDAAVIEGVEISEIAAWLEKQGEKANPYSGVSFDYNGHTWGMCARDNGVDISLDGQLFKHLDEQCGQNPTNKVEPKFKVGDKVLWKYDRSGVKTIARVSDCGTYWIEGQGCGSGWWAEHELEPLSVKEMAHRIAWETSKHYDPNACKQEWCEMAALDMASHLEKQGLIAKGWRKNDKDSKPPVKHSILMLTTHGVAEGEWLGDEWCQYRWSCKIKDEDVLYWMHLSDLEALEKQGETFPQTDVD